jgi:hypothetical protein
MKIRIFSVVLCAFFAATASTAPAQTATDNERQKAIIELLEVTGMNDMLKQIIDSVTTSVAQAIKKQKPELPAEALNILIEEVTHGFQARTPEMMANAALLYEKYFSAQEMRDITAFYKTPTGAKTLKVMPKLLPESIQLGQR